MSNHATKTSSLNLQSKIDELDQLTAWFSGEDFKLDQALSQYQVAIKLAESIQKDLQTLKNQVEILHENFTKQD